MQKNIVQDVLPPEKKSIRDVPIPRERRKPVMEEMLPGNSGDSFVTHTFEEKDLSKFEEPARGPRKVFIYALAIIAILILAFSFTMYFSSAKAFIVPKAKELDLDMSIKAGNNIAGRLNYEVIAVSKTIYREIPAAGEKLIREKASGKITIFNNEKSSQTLIKNTRFEAKEGLIYRIKEAVVVPGKNASSLEPGSLEVAVYADKEGPEYNIGITEFTIPGFKGDPRYKTIYARSKTSMAGGFNGVAKVAREEDVTEARQRLKGELKEILTAEVKAETPKDFIFFDGSSFIEYESLPDEPAENDKIKLAEKATVKGLIFDKKELAEFIANETIQDYDGEPVDILGLEAAEFEIISSNGSAPDKEKEEFDFALKGKVEAVWIYDEAEFKNALRGQSLNKVEAIISQYPAIDKVEIIIKPFWKKTLPKNPDKIRISKKES